jgi:hypothetical protein
MKSKHEYDLSTARGLFEFIGDYVFHTHQDGLSNDCWSALSDIYAKAKKCEELEEENNALRQLIYCKDCNGNGAGLSSNLGVFECPTCGGDGHLIEGKEGNSIKDLIEEALKDAQ